MKPAYLIMCGILLAGCATRPKPTVFATPALAKLAIVSAADDDGTPLGDPPPARQLGKRHDVLLLSGGGSLGAFGAGVLVGWSQAGTRPPFDVVTGISTGALMATLAFLGPARDADLTRAYTQITAKDVMKRRGIIGFARRASLYDRGPLERMIEEMVTETMLDEVAAEHRKGRRLYVGTTNLDNGVATVWDMGRIASSKDANRVQLYRQVLAASAAIPGLFSPVYISQSDGPPTMHVDGSIKQALLFRSYMIDPRGANEHVWAIVNGKVSFVGNTALSGTNSGSIIGRSVLEMLRTISYRAVARVYTMARNARAAYHLAYLPDADVEPSSISFEPAAMQRLFEAGRSIGAGGKWQAEPPHIERYERYERISQQN
ncbi:MAG: patatin-like phospholipase family protein [Sandarakinorhabdus sp.]